MLPIRCAGPACKKSEVSQVSGVGWSGWNAQARSVFPGWSLVRTRSETRTFTARIPWVTGEIQVFGWSSS